MGQAEGILIAPIWPTQVWWPPDVKTVDKAPSCSSTAEKPVKATQHGQTTPSSCKNGANGLLHIRRSYEARGISESTCNLLMASWRPGTQKQYQVYIQKCENLVYQPLTTFIPEVKRKVFERIKAYVAVSGALAESRVK